MLAVCSGWMAPAIRRFGLEILQPADLALEDEIASMRRARRPGVSAGVLAGIGGGKARHAEACNACFR